ncbi:Proteinase inhibitor I12, Bowman-Birk [Sesbania bispinosa]|nr:Proteinase inhibitor I12, Bowman-Birk [Sesbania bispinosa]
MELNKKGMVKVALLLFLLGFTATVDARFDPSSVIAQVLPKGGAGDGSYYVKSTTTACCDNCVCTKSNPPQCQCVDVKETCHSACKQCICYLKWPPACICTDITNFCYEPCDSSSKAEAHRE